MADDIFYVDSNAALHPTPYNIDSAKDAIGRYAENMVGVIYIIQLSPEEDGYVLMDEYVKIEGKLRCCYCGELCTVVKGCRFGADRYGLVAMANYNRHFDMHKCSSCFRYTCCHCTQRNGKCIHCHLDDIFEEIKIAEGIADAELYKYADQWADIREQLEAKIHCEREEIMESWEHCEDIVQEHPSPIAMEYEYGEDGDVVSLSFSY